MKLNESDMVSMQDEVLRLHKSNKVFFLLYYPLQSADYFHKKMSFEIEQMSFLKLMWIS